MPTRGLGRVGFELLADVRHQAPQKHFGQLGPRLTVGSRAGGAGCTPQRRQEHDDTGHGRHARLVLGQHLGDKRPQGERHGVDRVGVGAKADLLGGGHVLDLGCRQDLPERQVLIVHETLEKVPEGSAAGGWLIRWHRGPP